MATSSPQFPVSRRTLLAAAGAVSLSAALAACGGDGKGGGTSAAAAVGLTGTHVGCEQGACGSCTVLLDGVPIRSCLMFAVQVDGQHIETVEGLADGTELGALQAAMMREHGLQCGFCTPGILLTLTAAFRAGLCVEEAAGPQLAGHICRCTGYAGIRAAIERYWSSRKEG